jgi:hypothetical protein
MKARRKFLIVKSWDEQKESHQIKCDDGRVVNLYIGRRYSENSREQNPVVCEVLSKGADCDEIEVGDLLIVHHNVLTNEACIIERDTEQQFTIFSIYCDNTIYAKINPDGSLIPVNGNYIAERISKPPVSNFIIAPFEETVETQFIIKAVPKNPDVKVGDKVICYKYSDYEMVYHFNNEEKRAVRIWKEDMLGIMG